MSADSYLLGLEPKYSGLLMSIQMVKKPKNKTESLYYGSHLSWLNPSRTTRTTKNTDEDMVPPMQEYLVNMQEYLVRKRYYLLLPWEDLFLTSPVDCATGRRGRTMNFNFELKSLKAYCLTVPALLLLVLVFYAVLCTGLFFLLVYYESHSKVNVRVTLR